MDQETQFIILLVDSNLDTLFLDLDCIKRITIFGANKILLFRS